MSVSLRDYVQMNFKSLNYNLSLSLHGSRPFYKWSLYFSFIKVKFQVSKACNRSCNALVLRRKSCKSLRLLLIYQTYRSCSFARFYGNLTTLLTLWRRGELSRNALSDEEIYVFVSPKRTCFNLNINYSSEATRLKMYRSIMLNIFK